MNWIEVLGTLQDGIKKFTKEQFLMICGVVYDLVTKEKKK